METAQILCYVLLCTLSVCNTKILLPFFLHFRVQSQFPTPPPPHQIIYVCYNILNIQISNMTCCEKMGHLGFWVDIQCRKQVSRKNINMITSQVMTTLMNQGLNDNFRKIIISYIKLYTYGHLIMSIITFSLLYQHAAKNLNVQMDLKSEI